MITTSTGSYELTFDTYAINRVKALLGIDLCGDPAALAERFAAEPATFVDVLYCVVRPQCDAAGVTDEQFGRGLGTDGYTQAAEQFFVALSQRPDLRRSAREVLGAAARRGIDLSGVSHG